jgi:hypothetical protein
MNKVVIEHGTAQNFDSLFVGANQVFVTINGDRGQWYRVYDAIDGHFWFALCAALSQS